MPQFRPILITSIAFTVAAAAMWGIAVAWALTGTALPLTGAASAALSAIAAMCWLDLWRAQRDRDKALLIKTLADAAPAPAPVPALALAPPTPLRHPLAHTIPMLRAL